jgi:DNA helicase-2/ATP-dependent DNA helicase PcrA
LNVTDGNFPSEFSTGKDELIEEERRLLYVAMTRARRSLSLVVPLRFHVTQQRRDGDKHVYGARSRFVTDSLLATMQQSFHGREQGASAGFSPRSTRRLDVGTRLRDAWS